MSKEHLSFLKRASLTRHKCSQKLFKIMQDKETNLALAADLTKQNEVLELADHLGPTICVFKTHVDILEDFTKDFGGKLQALAEKHRFLIFEDRKFADIGQTVHLQYTKGIYKISEWAHLINAHIVPGPGIIEGLKGSNLLLLAQMSSAGTLAKGEYTQKAIEFSLKYPETVMGFISQKKLTENPGMIHFTPGVKLEAGKDQLGQRYRTVEEVIIEDLTDIIIVGRDITQNKDPLKRAHIYREKAWNAYVKR